MFLLVTELQPCLFCFSISDIVASAGDSGSMAQTLKVQKEARVRNMQEDRLGDEEWSLLTAAM